MPSPSTAPAPAAPPPRGEDRPLAAAVDPASFTDRYRNYVLGLLVVVYVFNFLDRQILSILAERIKADLAVSDAQMGFLYGTAFAVFFALFGIPLGRLADVWDRRRLIAWGLSAWSAMTALSGLATSFAGLALARVGVGVGEASASPAAYSLLADTFPRHRRATALAIYSSGIYLGSGLGLGLGGLVVDRWDAAFALGAAPFGLRGWQVAFLVVGLPGLLLALWVRTLREPLRGGMDGTPAAAEPHPWRELGRELAAVVPPFTAWTVAVRGGARALAANLAAAGAIALAAWGLTRWLGNPVQWIALGLGLYAATSWAQSLRRRDPASFALIFRTRSLQASNLAVALLSFNGYAWGFWVAPYLIRTFGVTPAQLGLVLGGMAAAGGWLGTTLGGVLADRFRRRSPAGRLWVVMANALLPVPLAIGFVQAKSLAVAYAFCLPAFVATSLWLGPAISTVQDLVLPRMRALASASFLLVVTFLGLALGPYTVGRLSVALGGLGPALLCALVANGLGFLCALYAARHLGADEASRFERAAAAGEPGARPVS